MKTNLVILLFFVSTFFTLGQAQQNDILGKWTATGLEHFDNNDVFDQEATDHFGNMSYGRTRAFRAKGLLEMPNYNDCSWYIENEYLYIRYEATGEWYKEEIIQLDDTILILRSEIDSPEVGNHQITKYKRVSE